MENSENKFLNVIYINPKNIKSLYIQYKNIIKHEYENQEDKLDDLDLWFDNFWHAQWDTLNTFSNLCDNPDVVKKSFYITMPKPPITDHKKNKICKNILNEYSQNEQKELEENDEEEFNPISISSVNISFYINEENGKVEYNVEKNSIPFKLLDSSDNNIPIQENGLKDILNNLYIQLNELNEGNNKISEEEIQMAKDIIDYYENNNDDIDNE